MGVRFTGRVGIAGGVPTFRPGISFSYSPNRRRGRKEVHDDGERVCYVYVIEADDGGVKIGISASPNRRLRQLSTGSTRHLRLVAQIPFSHGAKRVEAHVH